jgi:hypothetical protein
MIEETSYVAQRKNRRSAITKIYNIIGMLIATAAISACGQNTRPPKCDDFSAPTIAGKPVSTDFINAVEKALGPVPEIDLENLDEAIQMVRSKFPNASDSEIVDLLIIAYCPSVDPIGILETEQQEGIKSGFVRDVKAKLKADAASK